jgi:hypothetical protein
LGKVKCYICISSQRNSLKQFYSFEEPHNFEYPHDLDDAQHPFTAAGRLDVLIPRFTLLREIVSH